MVRVFLKKSMERVYKIIAQILSPKKTCLVCKSRLHNANSPYCNNCKNNSAERFEKSLSSIRHFVM